MIDDETLRSWFIREVLPLERSLTRFIRRNWRSPDDIIDIRQDIYESALSGVRTALPDSSRHYVYAIARNHLISLAKRAQIVSMDLVADLETVPQHVDMLAAERQLDARDQLRRAQAGLEQLSPRCREVVQLRKIEGLSTLEVAERFGVTKETIEQQLKMGMKALSNFMKGGSGRIEWSRFVVRRGRSTDQ